MPDSRVYFYNKVTRQSVWEKPKDFELVMPLPLNLAAIVGMESELYFVVLETPLGILGLHFCEFGQFVAVLIS